ncbi:MAG: aminotransferase class V-fold PLP-dependent enzyme [Pirellulaceae bacterium]|nr:aminotransferase class V-fold PLP-dependent enzyme [Pirellulaceae bacterium]
MRFYMDTARLGRACPNSLQVQCEFAQLAAEDPSLYSLDFLRDGAEVWHDSVRRRFPMLSRWRGVAHLQSMFADAFGMDVHGSIFLASQSAKLVRIAARLMFRQCRNVLTSDMNWPAWQAIVNEEAANNGATITHIKLADRVILDGWDDIEMSCLLAEHYVKKNCDCFFLPVVSSHGIGLPIEDLVARIRRYAELRFVLLDAAQAFCHVPVDGPMQSADVLITGCHKWLGAHLPMGVAAVKSYYVAAQLRQVFNYGDHVTYCHDPLLQLTEQIIRGQVNRYSETVDIAPMLSACGALASGHARPQHVCEQLHKRLSNRHGLVECFRESRWETLPLDDSIQTAILLAQSRGKQFSPTNPDELLAQFRNHGIGLSAYSNGTVRMALPSEKLQPDQLACLHSALYSVCT